MAAAAGALLRLVSSRHSVDGVAAAARPRPRHIGRQARAGAARGKAAGDHAVHIQDALQAGLGGTRSNRLKGASGHLV